MGEHDEKPVSAQDSWNRNSTIAVAAMLGLLGGADIWVYTAAEISALPQMQVHIARPDKLG